MVVVMFPPMSISNSRDELAASSSTTSQGQEELAIRIEQQRSKIRALELAAEERRRSNDLRIPEQAREELRQIHRGAREAAGALAVLPHKTATTQGAERSLLQSQAIFDNYHQGVHHLHRQACDEPAAHGLLLYDAREAQDGEQIRVSAARGRDVRIQAEERAEARIQARERKQAERTQVEERKLARLKAREQKQVLREQQAEQRLKEREQKEALRAQKDEQRRRDRMARDASAMEALLRFEAAAKAKEAQDVEERRLTKAKERKRNEEIAGERRSEKIREMQQRELLACQQNDQRRGERETQDQACSTSVAPHKESRVLSRQQRQRVHQRQAIFLQKEDQRHREREARDRAGLEALARHEAAARTKRAQEAEGRKLARLRETERKRTLRDRERELRQIEKEQRVSAARAKKVEDGLLRERVERQRDERSLGVLQRQVSRAVQEESRRRVRKERDDAGAQALQRHKDSTVQAEKVQRQALEEGHAVAFDGILPSFLDEEYRYMKQASAEFPELITASIQMECIKAYQSAISDASRRLACGICGGLFQENEVVNVALEDDNLQHFLHRTQSDPDRCAVKEDVVSLCTTCSFAIAKRAIPLLSAGNFVNCLFCQDYPEVLRNLNAVEEAFIARAHVVGIFLKLTSGAKKGISYRGSRGHSVAVRQDPSQLLKILPTRRLQDHTTITVSWDRASPPSEENLARFCSISKAKVLNALLWLCVNNPVYKPVVVDYSVLNSWPDHHIPQEIQDAFITLDSESAPQDAILEDEREGYATSLENGLFENELDAEVEEVEPGTILSRSFFSDLHGQDLGSTPATLASLQAILQDRGPEDLGLNEVQIINGPDSEADMTNSHSAVPHISYKASHELPLINSFTDPDYFTAAFPTLFPFGIGGHLGDAKGDRPEEVSLKAFAKYAMLHHSLL